MDTNYPYLGETVDNTYTLVEGIGTGGNDAVYKAEVNLDSFDYAMVAAYRDKEPEADAALELASPDGDHNERVSQRLKALRKDGLKDKIRESVEKNLRFYPYKNVCAVKILNIPDGISEEERKKQITRFEREWKNLMSITHRNVINIYGGGKTVLKGRETSYYSMECLEGLLYKEEIMGYPLNKKLDIVKQAAEGIKAIHSRDLIHRDIKPSNILVTQDDNVKITDAGIVKDMFKESELSAGQVFIGTPSFESPEQAGSIKDIDQRTDIYSLGAAFYYWLVGVEPYEDAKEASNMMDILYMLRRLHSYASGMQRDVYSVPKLPDDVMLPTPVKTFQDIPDPVVRVLRKMMNPHRELFRYQSIDEVISDLNALIEGKPVSAAAVKPVVQRKKAGKTRKASKKGRPEERIRPGLKKDRLKGRKEKTRKDKTREKEEGEEGDRAKPGKQKTAYIISGIAAGLAILIIALIFALKEEKPAVKTPEEIKAEKLAKDKEKHFQDLQALHKTILDIVKQNPENFALHEQNWGELIKDGAGTEYEEIGKKGLEQVSVQKKEAEEKKKQDAEAEYKKLEQSVNALIGKHQFGKALKECEDFPKDIKSAFPRINSGVMVFMARISENSKKEADAVVAKTKELCAKGEFNQAREAAKAILGFEIADLQVMYVKEVENIGNAEKEAARKKEDEIKSRCDNVLREVRNCMINRQFKKAISIIDEGTKKLPAEMAEEKLKSEREILVWAEKFMAQCMARAASKPDDVELTIEKIKGKIINYNPKTDEIEIELKTEHIQTARKGRLRKLGVDQLLRLSGWEKPLRHKPRETLAAACFIVLSIDREKAKPYFDKITESGLLNKDLEKALSTYEKGAKAVAEGE